MQFGGYTNGEVVEQWLTDNLFDNAKLRRFGELVGSQMVHRTLERFDNQVGPYAKPWKPSIRAKAQSGETLSDTGRLKGSITHNLLPNGVEWGTNVFYAPFNQHGAIIKPINGEYLSFMTAVGFFRVKEVNLPPRPFLGINATDEQDISDILTDILSDD